MIPVLVIFTFIICYLIFKPSKIDKRLRLIKKYNIPTVQQVKTNQQVLVTDKLEVVKTKLQILEQAQTKGEVFIWYTISHLNESDVIEIASALNKTQLNRWFKHHHYAGFHFPDRAYAFIQSKLNNQVWFSDEEYAARVAQGKRVTYITEDDLLIEGFEDVFYNQKLSFSEKMEFIEKLLHGKSKKVRLNIMLSYFDFAYEYIKAKNTDEEVKKKLRAVKNSQTRLYNKLELKEADVNLEILDQHIRLL